MNTALNLALSNSFLIGISHDNFRFLRRKYHLVIQNQTEPMEMDLYPSLVTEILSLRHKYFAKFHFDNFKHI